MVKIAIFLLFISIFNLNKPNVAALLTVSLAVFGLKMTIRYNESLFKTDIFYEN